MIRNQQKFVSYVPPTAVVKLLQYSGLGSNTGMGFLLETRSVVELTVGWMVINWEYKLKENLEMKTP